MTLGLAERQLDLLDDVVRFCEEALPASSVYAFLHRERDHLFPDELFADLFSQQGRRSVPPCVVATVMVLQRLGGLSDREAVERYTFDARWRYAAGVGGYEGERWGRFAHTVLVDMRERLRRSARPDRVFEAALGAARAAGLVGRRRVLDSTPLYDAVATMDTVTLIRSALRALLAAADPDLAGELRGRLTSGDDYATSAKPRIDWDDAAAREALIDSRAKDAVACLGLLDGRALAPGVKQAATLLASVVGQDLDQDLDPDLDLSGDGVFRIARRVAPDRVVSTVDPDARHGHKTAARGFDGYKGHVAVDPDSEIITATRVTPGNRGDATVAAELIDDLAPAPADAAPADAAPADAAPADAAPEADTPGTVYGDSAYGSGEFQALLEERGVESGCRTQSPTAPGGLFAKDRFTVDLDGGTVTCPAGAVAVLRMGPKGGGASFGRSCAACPLRDRCTTSAHGRSISVGAHEAQLARARERQADPDWKADYRATRPKVERKLAHLMYRRHGGRRARVRGTTRVDADFRLLAAAANLARLAVLGLTSTPAGAWAVTA